MSPLKPWWKRKRWQAFIIFWLLLAYPASVPPAHYFAGRGWLPTWALRVYTPLVWMFPTPTNDGSGFEFMNTFNDYNARWWSLGERHAAAQSD